MTEQQEHAEVGALLSRCEKAIIGGDEAGWNCWATLHNGRCGYAEDLPTQLAAIKAAVEAAEQGCGSEQA